MMGRMLRHPERRADGLGQICPDPGRADRGRGGGQRALSHCELSNTSVSGSPFLRAGMLMSLYLLWATVAGVVAIMLGYGISSLIAGAVPVPRRYLTAGGITTLALVAAWLGPSVVGRLAAPHRLTRASHRVARYGQAWIVGRFDRQT